MDASLLFRSMIRINRRVAYLDRALLCRRGHAVILYEESRPEPAPAPATRTRPHPRAPPTHPTQASRTLRRAPPTRSHTPPAAARRTGAADLLHDH